MKRINFNYNIAVILNNWENNVLSLYQEKRPHCSEIGKLNVKKINE